MEPKTRIINAPMEAFAEESICELKPPVFTSDWKESPKITT
jgi:hypothetical protein